MSKTHITHIENDNLGDGWLNGSYFSNPSLFMIKFLFLLYKGGGGGCGGVRDLFQTMIT